MKIRWQPDLPAGVSSFKNWFVMRNINSLLISRSCFILARQDYGIRSATNHRGQVFEDDMFTIRYLQKGSGHITFKRLDLVEKMNDIVAKHYPGALPAK